MLHPPGLPLHGGGADFLSGSTALQTLNLSKTLLTALQLGFLGGLGGLKRLNLSETYFGDAAACQVSLNPEPYRFVDTPTDPQLLNTAAACARATVLESCPSVFPGALVALVWHTVC